MDRALNELHMEDDFDLISDIGQILTEGILSTPALMINGRVISSGRIPSVEEVKGAIVEAQ